MQHSHPMRNNTGPWLPSSAAANNARAPATSRFDASLHDLIKRDADPRAGHRNHPNSRVLEGESTSCVAALWPDAFLAGTADWLVRTQQGSVRERGWPNRYTRDMLLLVSAGCRLKLPPAAPCRNNRGGLP
jgi:hypothetical protein